MFENTTILLLYYCHKKDMCRELDFVLSKRDKLNKIFTALIRIFTFTWFLWLFQPIQGPGLLCSSVIIFHRRVISPSQGRYLTTDNTNTE
jgi:hypothetical protein